MHEALYQSLSSSVSGPIIVFNRSEGMLAGLLALFLFGNIPADKNHDALFGSAHFTKVVQIFAAHSIDRDARLGSIRHPARDDSFLWKRHEDQWILEENC